MLTNCYLCIEYHTVIQVRSIDGDVNVHLGAALLGLLDGEHHAGEVERRERIIVPDLVCKVCSVYTVGRSTNNYQRLPGLEFRSFLNIIIATSLLSLK